MYHKEYFHFSWCMPWEFFPLIILRYILVCLHNRSLLHSHSSFLSCTFHCQYRSSALTYNVLRCSKTALIRSSLGSNTVLQPNNRVNLGELFNFSIFHYYLCKGVNNSISHMVFVRIN